MPQQRTRAIEVAKGKSDFDSTEQCGLWILTAVPKSEFGSRNWKVILRGDNYSGQLGIGDGSTNIAGIAGGRYHSVAYEHGRSRAAHRPDRME